jgi:hypothetical protein
MPCTTPPNEKRARNEIRECFVQQQTLTSRATHLMDGYIIALVGDSTKACMLSLILLLLLLPELFESMVRQTLNPRFSIDFGGNENVAFFFRHSTKLS